MRTRRKEQKKMIKQSHGKQEIEGEKEVIK